jgi:hypothetical protein
VLAQRSEPPPPNLERRREQAVHRASSPGRSGYSRPPVTHWTIRPGSPYPVLIQKTEDLLSREAAAGQQAETDLLWLSSRWEPLSG